MADLLKLAGRIAEITPSWFPIAGHVRNVTFTLDEADAVIEALNHAAGATNALAVRPAQDASKWSDRTTYVRKIADGQFEYGFLFRSTNFRKRPDVYNAEGVKATVCEAELARAQLEPAMATETHDELVADVMELIADGAQTDMPLEDIANNVILACRIPAGCGWQPVETAPHETRVLLGWYQPDGTWFSETGMASHGWRKGAYSTMSRHGAATHWQPIPDGPKHPSTVLKTEEPK